MIDSKELYISGLVQGEPVLKTRMSPPDRGLKMAQLVEPNMRAYVVQVSEQAASAQLIHPGALCDVIATITDPRNRETVSQRLFLQNIRVIAVGDSVDIERHNTVADQEKAVDERALTERHRVVTLLVSLGDAEYLAFSSSLGKLDLALRSEVDTLAVTTSGVSIEKVLGSARPKDGRSRYEGAAAPQPSAAPPPARSPSSKTRAHQPRCWVPPSTR